MKTGAQVRVIQPVIEGSVIARRINPATDDIELLVAYTDAANECHERWFAASQLEEVQPQGADQ
jgi:hypothetical protein